LPKGSKIFLVDGSALIFRAFFAIPPLRTAAGLPTNALHGFTQTLLRLLREEPAALAVAFEAPGPTFRHERYDQYKANRPPAPDDLKLQYPWCLDMVRALGLPALSVPGFEADDLIATLCSLGPGWGLEPVIYSGDKDLMQLVDEHVIMVDPFQDRRYDPAAVLAKMGVPPSGVVDLLALAGDNSDNVPGVPGIGPKTAAKLLAEFGDLDRLLAAADTVKGKRGESLRASREIVALARELVTLRRDVPLTLSPAELQPGTPDTVALRAMVQRFELRGLASQLPLGPAPATSPEAERAPAAGDEGPSVAGGDPLAGVRYRTLRTLDELRTALDDARRHGLLSVDTETTSRHPQRARLVGVSLAWRPDEACYLPLAHQGSDAGEQAPLEGALALLRPLLEDPDFAKYGQNHKYDHQVLANYGLDARGFAGDPMLASYLLAPDARSHGLDALAAQHLGHRMIPYSEVTQGATEDGAFAAVPVEAASRYAGEDAVATLVLAQRLGQQVDEAELSELYHEVELPLSRVLAKMERRGITLAAGQLEKMSRLFEARLLELEQECHHLAGHPFLVSSPKQLAEVLFDELALPVVKKTKTARSTDQAVLEQLGLQHPLPAKVLDYRQVAKLKNTYLDPLPLMVEPSTGRLHTSLKQAVAATGRLASSDPNLQNIPVRSEEGRRIREAFVAGPGRVLLSADYSQIELRVLAHMAEERGLQAAFRRGDDIHSATAAELFGLLPGLVAPEQRRAAKAINFGILYGMSAFRLAREQNMSRPQAQRFIDHYFQRYPRIRAWIDETLAQARARGYTTTLLGRRRWLPELNDRSHVARSAAERVATNTPIQGSAADIIKLAMLRLQRLEDEGKLAAQLLLQVHDELIFEVDPAEAEPQAALIRGAMEQAMDLSVPLSVELGQGTSWAEAH